MLGLYTTGAFFSLSLDNEPTSFSLLSYNELTSYSLSLDNEPIFISDI
jgi:hypothetical protein